MPDEDRALEAVRCSKCGSDDFYTRYRMKGAQLDDDNRRNKASDECLRRTCWCCGYRWTDPTIDKRAHTTTEGEP
jgi:hypothetical protein